VSQPFIGQITMFGGNFAPSSWAFCNGQLVPIAQNPALFSLLGTTYGGDGRINFALPDLRGRSPMHAGNGPGLSSRPLGQSGGSAEVSLSVSQIAAHNHGPRASGTGTTGTPSGAVLFAEGETVYGAAGDTVPTAAATIGDEGQGAVHQNRQPYQAVNFIIALQGVFPSRS